MADNKKLERISAADLCKVEAFLAGKEVDLRAIPDTDARMAMVEKYGLEKENAVQKTAKWVGDPIAVFEKLCQQWPDARRFKKYKGILYAMKYGDTPCTVYSSK